jgi:hypothetical protein
MTRILVFPPLLILAILAASADEPPKKPYDPDGPAMQPGYHPTGAKPPPGLGSPPVPVRLHVVSVDATVLRADDGTPPRLEIAVTGLAPTTGYDVRLVPLAGRPLEFELVGRPPPPGTPIAPVEQIFTVIRTVPLPEKLPAMVRVVQPERYVSRRVD